MSFSTVYRTLKRSYWGHNTILETHSKDHIGAIIKFLRYIKIIILVFPKHKQTELRNQHQKKVWEIHKYTEIKQHYSFCYWWWCFLLVFQIGYHLAHADLGWTWTPNPSASTPKCWDKQHTQLIQGSKKKSKALDVMKMKTQNHNS